MIAVALGNGDGTFGSWLGSNATGSPTRVAVGRFDGKNLDAVVNDGTSLNALVLLGDGTGHFANSTFIDLGGAFTYGFAIADFNSDHKEDLAVTTETGSGNVYVFLGNGDGTFQSAQVFLTGGQDPGPVLVGDFNRDGIEDLAVLNVGVPDSAGSVAVLLGNGDGTFQLPKLFPLPARFYTTSAIAVGDFNGDKKLDLAVLWYGSSGKPMIQTLLGNGDGTFRKGPGMAAGPGADSIATADFNGDGKLDLVVANASDLHGYVSVFLGNGDGTFQTPAHFSVSGKAPNQVIVADFNLDGKPDIATVNTLSNTVSILLNTTP